MTDPSTMTVAQLKEALKTRGLDATGLKAALVARLRAALESSDADAEATDGASDPRSRPPLPNVNPQPHASIEWECEPAAAAALESVSSATRERASQLMRRRHSALEE